jgi:hypothetical protein
MTDASASEQNKIALWEVLRDRLDRAAGPDAGLDADLTRALAGSEGAVTASPEAARAWARAALPGWHAHIGFDVTGILPYAAFSQADRHVEATAPTVPLAILRAALRALAG